MAFNFNLATGPIFGVHYNQTTENTEDTEKGIDQFSVFSVV